MVLVGMVLVWYGMVTSPDEVREVRRPKSTFWLRLGWFMMVLVLNHQNSPLVWLGLGWVRIWGDNLTRSGGPRQVVIQNSYPTMRSITKIN